MVHICRDNLPDVSIRRNGESGVFEIRWRDGNGGDLNALLLRGLSSLYPQCSMQGFKFSSGLGSKGVFSGDYLQMRDFVLVGLSDLQMMGMHKGLQTPGVSSQMLSIGMTPKTLRLPKTGEIIFSSWLTTWVYKGENMEAIHESEEG